MYYIICHTIYTMYTLYVRIYAYYIPSGIFNGAFILTHLRAKQLRKKPEAVAPWFNERVKSSEIGIVMDLSLTQSLNLSWLLFTNGFGQISWSSCYPEFWDLMWMGFDIFGSKQTAGTGDTANCFMRAEIQSNKGHHPVPRWKLVRCIWTLFMYHCHRFFKIYRHQNIKKHIFFYQLGYGIWRQKIHFCQGSKGTWFDNQFVKLLRISPTSVSFLVTLVTRMDWKFP